VHCNKINPVIPSSFIVIARAIETQCYVIAAAQYGRHNEKRESYGHSLVVDPWGTVVADAGGVDSSDGPVQETPSIVTCEVNSGLIGEIRQRMPIQEHRKTASTSMTLPIGSANQH
jgi:deaminated glutathione amidase